MNAIITHSERLLLPRISMILVALAVLIAHGSSIGGSFVWDDTYNIVQNEDIRALSNIPGFFSSAWGASAPEGSHAREKNKGLYRPLTLVSFTLDHAVYGLRPWAFHLSNMLIHLLSALLVLLLARRFCGPGAGLLLALFWAAHPVHTEAISVISYRTTLLAGLLGFAALHVQIFQKDRVRRLALRTLLVALACFAKEDGVVFAAILPLHDLLIRRESFRKAALYALPLLAFALAFFAIRAQILEALPYTFYGGASGEQQLAGVMQSTWLYSSLLIVPYPLTPFYDWTIFPIPETWLGFEVIAGLLITFILIVCAARFKKTPHRAFLALSLLLSLLPYTHLLPFAVGAAERFIYVPSFFALLLLAQVFMDLEERFSNHRSFRRMSTIVVVLWLIPFTAWSALRHRDWQSQLHITEATVDAYPSSFNAWKAYGDALNDAGSKEAAADAYARARSCAPLAIAPILEAEIRVELGQTDRALALIVRFLEKHAAALQRVDSAGLERLLEIQQSLGSP